jgi:hypothetical protein
MVIERTIHTQVILPIELYRAISRKAQTNGTSVSHEIVDMLSSSLARGPNELEREFDSLEEERSRNLLDLDSIIDLETTKDE